MIIEAYSDNKLVNEIQKSKEYCENFKKALNYIPETSILGRLSVYSALKREQKRYEKLTHEAWIRKLCY